MLKLSVENVTKTYRKGKIKALDGFSVEFTSGIYGLLGPNGAGKSTLMNIIADLIRADEGQVLFDGQNILKLGKKFRKRLGYMPQQQTLYEDFTGRRFLWYLAALKGLPAAETKEAVERLLETVRLREFAHKKLRTYSGGMKQRILLAQALLGDPDVLILDEPTAGLDPKERIRLRNHISEIALNKIVILATHVVSDVEFIAKEVLLMNKGRLIASGTAGKVTEPLQGKVFELSVHTDRLAELEKQYGISNLSSDSGGLRARVVTDEPPDSSFSPVVVRPGLEDVYLYLFNEKEA